MIGQAAHVARRTANRIWFRAGLYGLGGIAIVFLSAWLGPLLPPELSSWVDFDTVRGLLEMMASSMLLVATFSLGTMVAAYSLAASGATPRATIVLIDDPVSQNVLGTFVGAFVFSIVGLVALSMGLHGDNGRVVLLAATALVILGVVATLFGWLDYLANMVRIDRVMDKIEARAEAAFRARAKAPHLGGERLDAVPSGSAPVTLDRTGYVSFLDVPRLERVAAEAEGTIYVGAPPGALVDPSRPVAWTSWRPAEAERSAIRDAYTVENERSFDHDPRYGLIVLTEIASRALSPGVNDPGTAVAVIGRLQRLLTGWAAAGREAEPAGCRRVRAPALEAEDMFADAFGPLARDAAPVLEVGVRLQKGLGALAATGGPGFAAAARRQSGRALALARGELVLPEDVEALARLAAGVETGGSARA